MERNSLIAWTTVALLLVFLQTSTVAGNEAAGGAEERPKRYKIADIQWEHVQGAYTIVLWVLLASIAKIGFHLSKKFAEIFPDSSLLIVLGLVVGILLFLLEIHEDQFHLSDSLFFLFLLPPIVFDAGYFMPNRAFFDNLGTILVYAVFGTIWNMLTIGLSLYAVSLAGQFSVETPFFELMLFAALISAVDPVAVLVVFEEIHVNEMLFITVFGESLLNDAVTVVLYNMFKSFTLIGAENLIAQDYGFGVISFFVVALGGVLIGVVFAAIASLTTKFTTHVKILNPVFVFLVPYLAYLTAEMFKLSAIMAIAFCGIMMKQYIKVNTSEKAQATIKYMTKMLSSSSETIIFMFLGLSTVSTDHHWDTFFVVLTVIFCLVYRALGVVIQTYFINKFRLHRFNKVDQFIMSYGGLRGAIAYGLVVALPETVKAKQMFVTACIVVIYFTVFLQGMTMKPLVNFLKVEKDEKRRKTMNEHVLNHLVDHTVVGVEDILGYKGHHWIRDKYDRLNQRFLKPLLTRSVDIGGHSKIVRNYMRMKTKEAVNSAMTTVPSVNVLDAVAAASDEVNGGGIEGPSSYTNPAFLWTGEDPTGIPTSDDEIDSLFINPRKGTHYSRHGTEDDIELVEMRRTSLSISGAERSRSPSMVVPKQRLYSVDGGYLDPNRLTARRGSTSADQHRLRSVTDTQFPRKMVSFDQIDKLGRAADVQVQRQHLSVDSGHSARPTVEDRLDQVAELPVRRSTVPNPDESQEQLTPASSSKGVQRRRSLSPPRAPKEDGGGGLRAQELPFDFKKRLSIVPEREDVDVEAGAIGNGSRKKQ